MHFTVAYTRRCTVLHSEESKLPPRTDLDMAAQYRAADLDCHEGLRKANIKVFESTLESRGTHLFFLYLIINEVQRYQLKTHQVRIPRLALDLLAAELYGRMTAPSKDDKYSPCLKLLDKARLYTPGFVDDANETVKEYHEQQYSDLLATSSSSNDESD